MCLDPRPDRLYRAARPVRRLSTHALQGDGLAHALHPVVPPPVVRAPALWALETLAGDDELVARGWTVLSRQH